MKRKSFLLSIIILCSALSLNAQIDTITCCSWDTSSSSWNNLSRSIITYNNAGLIIGAISLDWHIDSWIYDWKDIRTYDSYGRETERIGYNWFTNNWSLKSKNTWTFDNMGHEVENAHYIWNGSVWNIDFMESNTFDNNGNKTLYETFWGFNGIIQPDFKTSYYYDTNNFIILEIELQWNVTDNNFDTICRHEYINDNSGNNLVETLFAWNYYGWEISYMRKFSYDQNNNMVSQVFYNTWTFHYFSRIDSIFYQYDTQGNLINREVYKWDGSTWTPDWRLGYVFDINGNLSIYYRQEWSGNYWENIDKERYFYDANGNMTESIEYFWNGFFWENEIKKTSSYDFNGNELEWSRYKFYNGDWHIEVKCFHVYNLTVGIDEPDALNDFQIFPLNANNLINIQTNRNFNIQIYNPRGQLLFSKEFTGNTGIDISEFVTGIYLLRIISNDIIITEKIIKE